MTNLDDEAVLRMLAGANFGPDSKVILPSGCTLGGDEAQALTSFYAPAVDTSTLDGDEVTQLARRMYETSPFTKGRTWPGHWDRLAAEVRADWYRKALGQWLAPPAAPPAAVRRRPWWLRWLGERAA